MNLADSVRLGNWIRVTPLVGVRIRIIIVALLKKNYSIHLSVYGLSAQNKTKGPF